MGRSSRKLDVVAVAAAASPIVESGNRILKKMKTIQEFSNENPSSNDPTTPSAPQMQSPNLSKTVTARNISLAIQKSEISLFFKHAGEVVNSWYDEQVDRECRHIEFATEEAAKKALELDGQNFGNRKILVDQYGTTTGASKTLIAKHLSFSITKSDFFKRFGEIIDVRFSSLDHDKFRKHCHIEFATEEGAKKAAEFNGRRWCGHLLELGFSREIIHVWGFDTSIEFEQIHSSLDKLFSTCGKILWMEIPTAPYTNITLGKAYIEFYDIRSFPKALAMNGHELGNSTLRVEDHSPRRLDAKQPGPRMKIGGRPVGPYLSGSYYPSRFFPHRGWYGHGIGKHGGILSYAYRTGKKIIFDDDCPDGRKVDKRSTLRVKDAVPKVDKSSTLSVEDAVQLQLDGAGIGKHDVHRAGKKIKSYDCPDGRKVDKRSPPLQLDGAGIGKHDVHRTGKKIIFDDGCPEGREVDTAHDDCAGIGKHDVYRTCSIHQLAWVRLVESTRYKRTVRGPKVDFGLISACWC